MLTNEISMLTRKRAKLAHMELDLKARLEVVMDQMKWTRAELVQHAEVSSALVSQWLGNGSRPVHGMRQLDPAKRLEKKTGFSAAWIATGIGPMHVELEEAPPPGASPAWPFQNIDPATWWSLDPDLRRRIEAMIEGAIAVNPTTPLEPTPTSKAAWSGMAMQIAKGVDAVTGSDQFRKFVQAVDSSFEADPGGSMGKSQSTRN
jgi:hypothetical protein